MSDKKFEIYDAEIFVKPLPALSSESPKAAKSLEAFESNDVSKSQDVRVKLQEVTNQLRAISTGLEMSGVAGLFHELPAHEEFKRASSWKPLEPEKECLSKRLHWNHDDGKRKASVRENTENPWDETHAHASAMHAFHNIVKNSLKIAERRTIQTDEERYYAIRQSVNAITEHYNAIDAIAKERPESMPLLAASQAIITMVTRKKPMLFDEAAQAAGHNLHFVKRELGVSETLLGKNAGSPESSVIAAELRQTAYQGHYSGRT